MKKCSKCKKEKKYDEFYKDKSASDGYNCICKCCRLEMDRKRRLSDPIWCLRRKMQNAIYHKENYEQIAKRKKLWLLSAKGKESHQSSSAKWKRQNTSKVRAHQAIERAVNRGDIIPKESCEVCRSKNRIEAHHPDHRKHLEVIWLCKKCHEKLT